MKKLLGYFGSFLLVGTPLLTTVSCNKTKTKNKGEGINDGNVTDENGKDENNKDDNKNIESGFEYDNENELSKQEKEIIKNTGLFTKLLLLSRHENLNFNANEVLSAVFAPKTTWNAFPRLYYVDGKKYDLTEYTDKLTTEYSNLGQLNAASRSEAFLPSALIGMYKDKLYTNYVSDIKENEDAAVFDYDTNDIISPSDKDRQQLAWANFTGPLSKYITDNNLFAYDDSGGYVSRGQYGRFLTEANSTTFPKNMVLTSDKSAFKVKDGLDLKEKIENSFGSLQQSIFSKQVKANFFAKILDFMPFVQNFNSSSTGSIYGLRLLNSIFPFTDTASNQDSVYMMFLALKYLCNWLSSFVNKKWSDEEVKEKYKTDELTELWNEINSNLNANGFEFLSLLIGQKNTKFKVQSLMNNNGTSVFDSLKEFINDAYESFKYWTEEDIKEFKKYIILKLGTLKMVAIALPKVPLKEVFEKVVEFFKRSDNSPIDLIKGLGKLMTVFADNQDKFLAISEDSKYKNKDFDMLSKVEQNNIATLFGYNGKNEFEKESILDGLYSLFNDPKNIANKPINDLLLSQESTIYQLSSEYSQFIHESLLHYAIDKNYWKILSKSFKMKGAIIGKDSLGAKINYSLEYNGKGDKTVTKFLDKPVELTNGFDPVMPWTNKTEVSKDWKAEDYIAYTGLGNNEFDDVNFKYDIQWSNLSDNTDFPYWVITKIDCFRKDGNAQWTQFYPVM